MAALRNENVGRLFFIGASIFERLTLEHLRELGFEDLRPVHCAFLRALPLEGMRTTEIARVAGMTKQAIGQLAIELERLGYVQRLPDPTDGRAKIVKFASRGEAFIATFPQVFWRAEAKIEKMVGASEFLVMRRALKMLALRWKEHGDDDGVV
jgi:DNA-binding MarR family transcriptional regulator